MNVSLILSAGTGIRFGNELPKQYHSLLGREVISYSVDALKKSALTGVIVIVAGRDDLPRLSREYGVPCVEGGPTRNASLKIGLEYIKNNHAECRNVFINEAVRPFLTSGLADRYYEYLEEYDAVITAQHITDSLGREGHGVTDRSQYYLIQAPEAFRFGLLYRHFKADSPATATVQQLPLCSSVMKYFDYRHNMKITYCEDLLYAEQIMRLDR